LNAALTRKTDQQIMTSTGRAVGIDFGSRRIGVAVSDAGRMVATPFETIKRVGDRTVEHSRIEAIVEETGATVVVVGLPRSLDGSDGHAAKLVRSEIRGLSRRLSVPIEEYDERFTTVTAERSLRVTGTKGKAKRNVIDQVAAAVLLQGWLDALQ
jgi:putative Holliday junction resolvase